MDDSQWMARALALAERGKGLTRPNPTVGAVVVSPEGKLLGEGWHRRAGQPHAEVEALEEVRRRGNDPHGATMYVTLEPCNHHGRTPPCTEAILAAGIGRVVIAQRDPNREARGGVERLQAEGVTVTTDVLRQEALRLNEAFNIFHGMQRPLITLKWAMTLDGCTAMASGDSKWITGEEARREVHRRRAAHDAVLAGRGTVLRDKARLTVRLPAGDAGAPPPGVRRHRIVLDSALSLPPDAPFLAHCPESTPLVFCCEDAPRQRRKVLEEAGAEVIALERGPGGVSLPGLFFTLWQRGIQSVYVEGGRRLAGALVDEGYVDRVECWVAPKLAGGAATPHLGPTASPRPWMKMSESIAVEELMVTRFGADMLLEGWVFDWQGFVPGGGEHRRPEGQA